MRAIEIELESSLGYVEKIAKSFGNGKSADELEKIRK